MKTGPVVLGCKVEIFFFFFFLRHLRADELTVVRAGDENSSMTPRFLSWATGGHCHISY